MTRGKGGDRARVARVLQSVAALDDPVSAPPYVRQDPGALALPGLVDAADYHRITPALWLAIGDDPRLPEVARRALMTAHHGQVFRHTAILGNLSGLAALLDQLGCAWAVLKGPHLAEYVHARPDLRIYGDLDVLVDRQALPAVLDALRDSGAEILDRNWTLIREGQRAQITLLLSLETPLDLHWHLLNRGPIRHAFQLDVPAVLERAHRVQLGPVSVPVLDDVDALIHLCLHATVEGAAKLVWTYDVHAMMTRKHPDAQQLVERAHQSGAALAVAVMLQRAQAALGTPVSADLLGALAPRWGWRAVNRGLEDVRPLAQNYGRRGTGRTIIRATRSSDAASMREFRHTAVRNTWARIIHDGSRVGIGSAEHVDLLREVGGTDADRDAFIAWVSTAPDY